MPRSLLGMVVLGWIGCAVAGPSGPFVPARSDAVVKTEAQWRAELDAEEYRILRQAGTERAFTGKYWDQKAAGVYHCAACGLPLFDAGTKFKSGTGWPSFTAPISTDRVAEDADASMGVVRTEILCNRCGGHLGHVFPDGPAPTGQRFCVNGNALDFLAAVPVSE